MGSHEILDEKGLYGGGNTMPMWGTVTDKAGSPIHAQMGKWKTAFGNMGQEQGGLDAGPQAAYLEQNRNLMEFKMKKQVSER